MLTWSIESRRATTVIRLSGTLRSPSGLDEISRKLAEESFSPPFEIDTSGLTQISSIGVRAWVGFLSSSLGGGDQVQLVNTSREFMHQSAMIQSFVGNATVRSAELPFHCYHCGHATVKRVDFLHDSEGVLDEAPTCSACGEQSELDELPEVYKPWFQQ